jgi:hypothetical protein
MPAKAGIQTWPRVPGLWIPAFAGMTTTLKERILNDARDWEAGVPLASGANWA